MTLRERTGEIEREFGVRICPRQLGRWYKGVGVHYLKPKYTYKSQKTLKEKHGEQLEFTCELLHRMMKKQNVIYLDETSFHLWMKRARIWRWADAAATEL